MKLFYSTTSPYTRIVRIALMEKGVEPIQHLTDPWKDDPGLLAANPSARVPTLLLDDGRALTESLLIIQWLEITYPGRSLLGTDPAAALSQAGIAFGAIDAAAAIIIGRRMTDAGFDQSPVGLRRRRSIIEAVKRLETQLPSEHVETPTIATIASVVLIDYLHFRFPRAEWLPSTANLDRLSERHRLRPSFETTLPCDMPVA
ncbi:Glutathione S-transferase domain (plasmid) [Rhizobium leguminosarum bv. trifolii WSM2304]|uniref:Glutathione S-transferase domain n=1 Tax=Rhizobium leguminosarum bv. trifolii (strain WSM2304) TaxID=395492 RepID=A0ABF7QZB3_RHILW|nr:glutathione S-transferase family protein [Rhizobium leguminosarum]ACI59501.1 Glutathione S-transferase domain [Rhizobium leguminosarum bv. trifolii WSM2304]